MRRPASSVILAARLLKAFSGEEAEIGISDLSRTLGIAKSTLHRLASDLMAEGLLEQNPDTGRYRLGIGLFSLGALARRRMDVSSESRPYLSQLREKTDETVHLAILDGTDTIYISIMESMQAVRMRSDLGVRKPAYCTAEGQVMLAFQPEALIAELIQDGLRPRTPHTIVKPQALVKTLDLVRRRGYAIEDEESEIGVRCVAAPIRNESGEVVAAVGLAGPVSRLSKKTIVGLVPLVVGTADTVSHRLGHRLRAAI